ncbi:MAG: TonB-dependent receptor [Deltaproteobacteria bacterium]|nr:TonB-dependent receptor [Deltaproteobacteria bacterium]
MLRVLSIILGMTLSQIVSARVPRARAELTVEGTADPQTTTDHVDVSGATLHLEEVIVEAKRPLSAASSDEIRAKDYELRPHATTQEILSNVPGLIVAQHQGGGKATQYLIRGFDADHGTDFAVFVDDLPVNLPTHAHGQGYADLNFLIPETVDRLQLYKGPYFAQLGDFANAGALNIVTKDEFAENFVLAQGGSFATQRYVVGASPKLGNVKTLLAAQAYFTDGPFDDPERYSRYNAFAKFTLDPTAESKLALSIGAYAGQWHGSGQIPLREVHAGVLDRFGSIDPSEGGKSDRENVNLQYEYKPSDTDMWSFQLYGSRYKLALYTDFTFFKNTGLRFIRQADHTIIDTGDGPVIPDANYIPGDGILQNDQRYLYGARAHYTHYWALADIPLQSQVGFENRNDDIRVALQRQVRRRPFFTINKLGVLESSFSGFMQQQVFFTDWIRLEVGLRGDIFLFDGRNRLPQQASDPNFDPVAVSGNTTDGIISPKANLVITPLRDTDVYLNFGEGYHSNDARNGLLAKDTDFSPLARSIGYEIGARTHQFDRLDAAVALWKLDLDSELVFSGDAGNQETGAGGTFEPAGKTRRYGVDLEARYRLTDWLFADYDLSWAHAVFTNGDAIPLAPTLLMNGGLTTEFSNGFSAALRIRYLDDRPAIEDRSLTARGYTLLDLIGKYRWRNVELSLAILNLTNTDWREAQFADTTCVASEVGVVPGCAAKPGKQSSHAQGPPNDIHFTPGNPIGVRGGVTLFF